MSEPVLDPVPSVPVQIPFAVVQVISTKTATYLELQCEPGLALLKGAKGTLTVEEFGK